MKTLSLLICFFVSFISLASANGLLRSLGPKLYVNLQNSYDDEAVERGIRLQTVISNNQSKSDWFKVQQVNRFYNQNIHYTEDQQLWNKEDYWASPFETLGHGKGDCEDYAIAKFFTLKTLGIAENKLRMLYVRHLKLDQPHMVLIYFSEPGAQPLVLDNFNQKILHISKRTDLKPIYSFNNEGVWMANAQGIGDKITNSQGVSNWDKLLLKMQAENEYFDTKP